MKCNSQFVITTLLAAMTHVSVIYAETVWSWEDCLHYAAIHNPQLSSLSARIQAAESVVRIARTPLRPQIALGAGADRSGVRQSPTDPETDLRATARIDQVLYTGGRIDAKVQESLAGLAVTEAGAWSTAADLTFSLRTSYIELLHAQKEHTLLRKIKKRRQDNFELVELLYHGGKEHKGSFALSQASLFQAQTDVRLADRRISLAQRVLQRAVGLDSLYSDLRVEGELAVLPPPEFVDWTELLENTPEYARALAQREIAMAGIQEARSGFRPEIVASGSAGRFGDHREFERDQWRTGIALSYPLWPGGRHRYELQRSRALLEETDFLIEDTLNQVLRNLEESFNAYRNAIDLVVVREHFLEASELRAEIARQQYTSGLLSFEEWSRIENDLIDNHRLLLSAQQAAMRAEARWMRTAGQTAFNHLALGEKQ